MHSESDFSLLWWIIIIIFIIKLVAEQGKGGVTNGLLSAGATDTW